MYDGMIKAFNRAIGSLGAVLLSRKGSGENCTTQIIMCISLINPEDEKLADVHVW
jgi:hypothetical protein